MTPPVPDGPDTELAAAIAYFRARGPHFGLHQRRLPLLHAATIVRAVLARPAAGRDLTEQDVALVVRDYLGLRRTAHQLADDLNYIARPAVARTDGQPPADEPLDAAEIDRLSSEDPDDRACREAHGFAYDDDWTDPTVICRNGCGETYDEIVASKMRTCAAAAPADDTAAPDGVELLDRACGFAEAVLFGDHPEDAPGTVRDGLAQGWMAGYRAAGQPVRDSQPEATDG